MSGNITFTMIKPDAVKENHIGEILKIIIDAGFKIKALKMTRLSKIQAEGFYAIHKEKAFFNDLVSFMTSGPVVAAILEKENAVEDFRNLIGSTNPANAENGTIRKLFASSVQENAIHGSDSDDNAVIEANYFFSQLERF
jgi:nucleoside-diphosphate kinase